MNRPIKFRGRDIITGNWAYGFYYKSKGNHIIRDEKDNERIVLEKSVGQFTGLLDKNGKEIYEGDILRLQYPFKENADDEEYEWHELIVKIDFHGGAFWFTGGGYTDCNWHFYNAVDREIIGNIYENPDLLK